MNPSSNDQHLNFSNSDSSSTSSILDTYIYGNISSDSDGNISTYYDLVETEDYLNKASECQTNASCYITKRSDENTTLVIGTEDYLNIAPECETNASCYITKQSDENTTLVIGTEIFLESEDETIDNYDSNKDPDYIPLKKQNIEEVLLTEETEEQNQIKTKTKRKITPKEKLTRKRTRNEEEWQDVKAKTKLNFGEEHLNRSGKLKMAKKMGEPCNLTCRLKCVDKVSDEIRKKLFTDYWNLGDHSRQWDFIARYVKVSKKEVGSVNSRRKFSRKYFFPAANNNTEFQVCRSMFLRTFSISEKVVHTVCSKLENTPVLIADRRGKHTNRPFKISNEVKECIKEHISLFPLVESHYTRERTKKQYLESDLNISKMHRFYKEWVKEKIVSEEAENVTVRQYSDVFGNYGNISFFKPKKDMCDTCEKYKLASTEEKEVQQTSYDQHLLNKNIARQMKNADKDRGILDPKLCVAAFYLQKVLTTPQGETSSFYYKRKFATYNLTVYDIGKKRVLFYKE